jgi:predicted enzyme related to lactoylglutathione lyase
MPEMTRYEPGTPSWADVSAPDVPAVARFYSGLFGWDALDQGEEAGHYTMFELRGKAVAAAGPKMEGDPGPPAWTTYVTVADADATAAKITANGGMVLLEPMDVLDVGRMAVAMDPTGGAFAIWEPRAHIGAQLVGETGAMCWNELTVRDVDTALAFYRAVFGWDVELQHADDGAAFTYRELRLGGSTIGGCMQMDENFPPDIPTHWMVYFAVDDTDAAAARVQELGGAVPVPPTDIPPGRFAVCTDPSGAVFSVIHITRPM